MGLRRKARETALQMLFQWDITKDSPDRIVETFWELHEVQDDMREFAQQLFVGTVDRVEDIDRLIRKHAEHWRLDRMATVDRNLLRLAVFEFLAEVDTPKTIVIDEAIEISRRFSSQESPQFINGILDGIKRELEGRESRRD